MFKSLGNLLRALLGDSLARIIGGAGLAVVSYAGLSAIVGGALQLAVSYFGAISPKLAAVILMSGVGTAMTAIGTGIMTRIGLIAGGLAIRKKRA